MAVDPIAGGPLEPPGRFADVEPRSWLLARAVRELEDELEELALFGVLKRFKAFASEVPPACAPAAPGVAAVPLPDDAPVAAPEDDPDCVDEDASAAVLELEADDDELPCPDGRNVGVLEIAVVVARDADGSAESGPCRLPRNCGTISAA